MRRMLCIVSEQQVPNVLGALHYQPDQIHLLVTERFHEAEQCKNFADALSHAEFSRPQPAVEHRLSATTHTEEITDVVRSLLAKYPTDEWVFNMSGGTKPLAAALYAIGKATPNVQLIYMDVTRPTVFVDPTSGVETAIDVRLTLQDYFAACLGRVARPPIPSAEAQRVAVELAALRQERFIEPWVEYEGNGNDSARLFLTPENIHHRARLLPMLDAIETHRREKFLISGWLECLLFCAVNRVGRSFRVNDACHSLKTYSVDDSLTDQRGKPVVIENELDVAFTAENSLYWIECKAGSLNHAEGHTDTTHNNRGKSGKNSGSKKDKKHTDVAELFYNIAAKTKGFRALGAHDAIVACSDKVEQVQQLARAKLLGVAVFSLGDITDIARGLQANDLRRVKTVLAKWLPCYD